MKGAPALKPLPKGEGKEGLFEDLKTLVLQYNEAHMIIREISTEGTPEGVFKRIRDGISRGLDYQRVGLWFLNKGQRRLEAAYSSGYPAGRFEGKVIPLNDPDDPIVAVLKELKPIIIDPQREKGPFPEGYRRLDKGVSEVAVIPIVNVGRKGCWQIANCKKRNCPFYERNGLKPSPPPKTTSFNWVFCEYFPAYGVVTVDSPPADRRIDDDLYPLKIVCNYAGILLERLFLFQKIKELSIRDPLTGAYNRAFFFEQLAMELRRAKRAGGKFCIAMIDIDSFKEINDQYGHLAGDRVLRRVSSVINSQIRGMDILCRYGGDEFALLLPDTDAQGGRVVMRRIKKAVSGLTFLFAGERVNVSLSGGISSFPQDSINLERLITLADEKMYEEKLEKKRGGKEEPEEDFFLN